MLFELFSSNKPEPEQAIEDLVKAAKSGNYDGWKDAWSKNMDQDGDYRFINSKERNGFS